MAWSRFKQSTPVHIALLYAVMGGLWILFSDRLLDLLMTDHHLLMRIQTVKGWIFVGFSALLLYGLVNQGMRALRASEQHLRQSYSDLEATHEELAATHEELVAAEEELKGQFEEIQAREAYFRSIYEGVSSGIIVQERSGQVPWRLQANDSACRLLNLERKLVFGDRQDGEAPSHYRVDGNSLLWPELREHLTQEESLHRYQDIEVLGEKEKPNRWLLAYSDAVFNAQLEQEEVVTTLIDRTEERRLESYAAILKEIDQGVLTQIPLAKIQQDLCQQLVIRLGFPLVWVGAKEEDGSVAVRAQAGTEEIIKQTVRWDDSRQGQGAVGRTIRSGVPHAYTLEGNPYFTAWADFFAEHKIRSVAAFPLLKQGEVFGVLVLYSDVADFFEPKRMAFFEHFSLQLALAFSHAQNREHLERFRILAEQANEAILFIGSDGRIKDVNQAATTLYGYTYQELLNLNVRDLRVPEARPEVASLLAKAEGGLHFESLHLTKGGQVFPVEVSSKGAVLSEQPLILGIIRDITERKRAEEEIWLAKERAQVTLDSIGDAVLTTDVQGRIEYLNPVAEELTGWKQAEVQGDPLEKAFRIVSESSGETAVNPVLRCLKEGGIVGLANHTVLIHRDGERIAIEDSAAPILDRRGTIIGVVLVFHDVSEKRSLMRQLHHQAHHDALTGLPNRLLFNEHLSQALAQAKWKQGKLAVLFLDLDRFKLINDTMGHNSGDLLLKRVTERLRQGLREGDTIGRQGGDEFLLLLPNLNQEEDAAVVAEKILRLFTVPFYLNENTVFMTPSIGISLYPTDGVDLETLVKQADTAMYHAKEQGRNNYQFFTEELNARVHERLAVENQLRRALERREFLFHYQPQVDLTTGEIIGLETLIRWQSPERGLVFPGTFIPIAEETDLIVPIGELVIRNACIQNQIWQQKGYPSRRIAVNISTRQFRQLQFIERVAAILAECGLAPWWLELEITESIAMENGEASINQLRRLKELGVRIAIDDFGTGFSSLNYLRRLPIDVLKIDQSFVRDIGSDRNGEAVIAGIIQLAKKLQLEVIAEGVETEEQMAFLKAEHCDGMQGFLFSKPLPLAEVEELL